MELTHFCRPLSLTISLSCLLNPLYMSEFFLKIKLHVLLDLHHPSLGEPSSSNQLI